MMFIYAHFLKSVNLIPCFCSDTAILLELRSSIMVNYFYVKERFFYIKSLKIYLGKFTYLLYCRVNGYNFWVDTLQQGMLRFDKLFFAKRSCSQVLLKYVENFMKKICLIKIRASTTSYYIL